MDQELQELSAQLDALFAWDAESDPALSTARLLEAHRCESWMYTANSGCSALFFYTFPTYPDWIRPHIRSYVKQKGATQ